MKSAGHGRAEHAGETAMDLRMALERIDAATARAFVTAARHVIDAMLVEAGRVAQTRTPGPVDYRSAELSREGPAGGWISETELRTTVQRMTEAVAAEKWVDGALFALRALAALGAL